MNQELCPVPQPSNPPPHFTVEVSPDTTESLPPPPSPIADPESQAVDDAPQNILQWQNAILAFCFTAALEISLRFSQTHSRLSLSFSLVSFGIILTFALLLLAKFISSSSSSNKVSKVLEKVAFLLAIATFYYTITIPFSFGFKCIIWFIFAISLLIPAIYKRNFHITERWLG